MVGSPPGGGGGKRGGGTGGGGGATFSQILRSQSHGAQTWNGAPTGKGGKRRKQKLMSTTSHRQYK